MNKNERKIAENAITTVAPALAGELLDMLGDERGLFHVIRANSEGTAGIVIVCNESTGCMALHELVRRIQALSTVETSFEAAVDVGPRRKRGVM